MAIDLITERISTLATSPRTSFSQDSVDGNNANNLFQSDPSPIDSSPDFNFCISNNTAVETCSADELFYDGLIRPLQLQERFVVPKNLSFSRPQSHQTSLIPPRAIETSEEINFKEEIIPKKTEAELKISNQSKSFWSIKRSCSLHCNSSHKKSSFWSLPLLSRSKSTGSIPKGLKEGQKQNPNPNKQPKKSTGSSASSVYFYAYPLSHKQPSLRKSYRGSNLSGVGIFPVIYVPPPCTIKGTANLFGLGSLFKNGKHKTKK
ncbi:hypothetical protein Leryth_009396 [Lithospermum erythrorhizon]|nr:hypothetical protein Leryth_009396 [Lithospermum erythrorhizon]